MGCDIHLHTEIKVKGKWLHYGAPECPRNYSLFSKMAGVRSSEDRPIAICQPRGVPDDASDVTKFCCEERGEDGHSHSWLSALEIQEVQDWWEADAPEDKKHRFELDICGYLFGSTWGGFAKYPSDSRRARELGLEDIRWVFWFDN